jgi:hypothetical protein
VSFTFQKTGATDWVRALNSQNGNGCDSFLLSTPANEATAKADFRKLHMSVIGG